MIWEVHQDTLGSNRVKSSKPSPSCPERPSFWPHVWAGIPKTVGPAAPASWWGANAFFAHPTPPLLAKAAVWWDEEGRRTGDRRRQGRTGKVGGRGSEGGRPRLAWEWSSSVPEPGLLLKHTNTFQQVLRQTHYSSGQYVFLCRKEPPAASSSWDVGCRTQSNGPALLRPLTLMPVRRRHQGLKIASASPTPTLGPALSRDSSCQSTSFREGSVFLDEDDLWCVSILSGLFLPRKATRKHVSSVKHSVRKDSWVLPSLSTWFKANSVKGWGPVCGMNWDRQTRYYGRATRENGPPGRLASRVTESSSFRSCNPEVHWTRWPWFWEE